jgi:hypothetical protein
MLTYTCNAEEDNFNIVRDGQVECISECVEKIRGLLGELVTEKGVMKRS